MTISEEFNMSLPSHLRGKEFEEIVLLCLKEFQLTLRNLEERIEKLESK